jgi:adenine-specific DNA-methyltransferase
MELGRIESDRRSVTEGLDEARQRLLGQYFTPVSIGRFMSSLFKLNPGDGDKEVKILEAGAGIGTLVATLLDRLQGSRSLSQVEVRAYEVDAALAPVCRSTLEGYKPAYEAGGKLLTSTVLQEDFILSAAVQLSEMDGAGGYDMALLNPPYGKMNRSSEHRRTLSGVGIETVNLYSAFVMLSVRLLRPGGQLVAILPRSFCNGPYYRSFRKEILQACAFRHIHLFAARDRAFSDSGVLQENVILHLEKSAPQGGVVVSSSSDGTFEDMQSHEVAFTDLVRPGSPEQFIHIPLPGVGVSLEGAHLVDSTLEGLGLEVSTGPVVDFRVKTELRKDLEVGTAPLIYPKHFNGWGLDHPLKDFKKWNAIRVNERTTSQLYPSGHYVVVRRFSSKEEHRRIVARVVSPEDAPGGYIAFENHLNVFHRGRGGVGKLEAYGMAAYLNSGQVDGYFRRFSGHTQVNATDLRGLPYPNKAVLKKLGRWASRQQHMDLGAIDKKVDTVLFKQEQ